MVRLLAQKTKLPEAQRNMAMIDLAREILESEKQPLPFQKIVDQLNDVKPPAKEEYEEQIARLYTNLNLDGRFISIGESHWGLRGWYPFDQKEEDIDLPKPKRKRKKKKDEEDLEDEEEDEDEGLVEMDEEEDDVDEEIDEMIEEEQESSEGDNPKDEKS